MNFAAIWQAVRARVIAFLDPTAWLIFAFTILPLLFVDPVMVKTVVQWSAVGLAFAGLVVMLSRAILPQINLAEFVIEAKRGNQAAGLVVLGVVMFMAALFLGLVLWAKA